MPLAAPLLKYPSERRAVPVDFASKLSPSEVLIPNPAVTTNDPALTATIVGFTDTTVTIRIAAGAVGVDYDVTVTAPTSQSNVLTEVVSVEVRDDAN